MTGDCDNGICAFHLAEVEQRKGQRREMDRQQEDIDKQKEQIGSLSGLKTFFLITNILITLGLFFIGGSFFFTNEIRKEANSRDEKINEKILNITEQVSRLATLSERVIESNHFEVKDEKEKKN